MMAPNASNLGAKAAGGAGKMSLGQVARVLIQLCGVVILARLLTPEDYGLVAMVMAIIGIAGILRDFGLTFASVQSREMTPAMRSNLFWVNAAVGVVAAILVVAASWPIAAFYGDDRLVTVTWALAPIYLINALSAQYQADLNRRMRFGALVIVDVGSNALALICGVAAALVGFEYWALVVQQLGIAGFGLVFNVFLGKWVPRLYDRAVSINSQVGNGFYIFLSQILNYASRNADVMIIGARLDAGVAGHYNQAFNLYSTPVRAINSPATRIAVAVLAKVQDDVDSFRKFIVKAQIAITHPVMLVMACGLAFGSVLVPWVLGDRWTATGPILQILCVAGAAQVSNLPVAWCYIATGTNKENFKLQVVYRPLTIVALFVGSYWGVVGVATAFVIGQVGGWLLQLWWCKRVEIVPRRDLLVVGLRGWGLYVVPGAIAAVVVEVLPADYAVIGGIGAFVASIGVAVLASKHVRNDIGIAIGATRSMVRNTLRGRS